MEPRSNHSIGTSSFRAQWTFWSGRSANAAFVILIAAISGFICWQTEVVSQPNWLQAIVIGLTIGFVCGHLSDATAFSTSVQFAGAFWLGELLTLWHLPDFGDTSITFFTSIAVFNIVPLLSAFAVVFGAWLREPRVELSNHGVSFPAWKRTAHPPRSRLRSDWLSSLVQGSRIARH